jgi:hypothetical protein
LYQAWLRQQQEMTTHHERGSRSSNDLRLHPSQRQSGGRYGRKEDSRFIPSSHSNGSDSPGQAEKKTGTLQAYDGQSPALQTVGQRAPYVIPGAHRGASPGGPPGLRPQKRGQRPSRVGSVNDLDHVDEEMQRLKVWRFLL